MTAFPCSYYSVHSSVIVDTKQTLQHYTEELEKQQTADVIKMHCYYSGHVMFDVASSQLITGIQTIKSSS